MDGIQQIIDDTLSSAIANGTDALYDAFGINPEGLKLAQTIINLASSSVSKVLSILNMFPKSITVIPSGTETLSVLTSSYMDYIVAAI